MGPLPLMARTKAFLAPINQGEVSLVALARVDLQRMQGAAQLCQNIVPLIEGAAKFRGGTVYSGNITKDNQRARLMAFQATSAATALLEMTPNAMRVIVDGQAVSRPSILTPWSNPAFMTGVAPWVPVADIDCSVTAISPGLSMLATRLGKCQITRTVNIGSVGFEHALRIVSSGHPIRFRVGTTLTSDDVVQTTTLLPGTHSIAFSPVTLVVYVVIETVEAGRVIISQIDLEASGPLQVPTPWGAADLQNLRTDQSADVVFVTDGRQQPRRIERRSMRSWSITEYAPNNGPFTNERPEEILLTPSFLTGEIFVTASAPLFSALNIGQLIELNHGAQNTIERLYAEGHATAPVQVTGFGTQRILSMSITGITGTGTKAALTRSPEKDGRYSDFSNGVNVYTADGAFSFNDALDGRDLWYRLEISKGNYSSGSPLVGIGTKSGSQRGIVRITQVLSPTLVTAEVQDQIGDTAATKQWRLGDWSDANGWPSALVLHDGRLFLFRRDQDYGSVSDDYANFDQGTVGDSAPIIRRAGAGPVEGAVWAVSLQRLIVGSSTAVRSARASSFDSPLTPTSYLSRDVTTRGSTRLSPLKLDSSAVYVTRDHRRVMELSYSVDANDYVATNLTRLSRDILGGLTVVDMAVQRHPETRLWFVLEDGTARVVSYDRDEQVVAWWRFVTDGQIETITTIPTRAGSEVWMAVNRSVGAGSSRYIERAVFDAEADGGPISVMSDCSVIYQGAAITTMTGLGHIEGRQVIVWADGEVLFDEDNPVTVTGGQIALGKSATNVVAGLAYQGRFKGARAAFGGQMGTAISQRKQVNAASPVLVRSAIGGLRLGPNFSETSRLSEIVRGRPINTKAVIESYDVDPQVFQTWTDPDFRMHMTMKGPYPITIAGLMVDVLTHES
jgi:hypothetical protein